MHKDAYVRLGPARPQVFGPAEAPDALLFIDVEHGLSLADMRRVPHEIYSNIRYILVRLDEGEIEANSDIVQNRRCYVGRIHQHVGHPTRITWIRDTETLSMEAEQELLRRARAIELTALLHWGRAIWEPTDHHYLLPSGRHAATFIKLANAIRGTRDAIVLARWMVHHFDADDTGLVIDTGTLSAVALAIDSELRRADRRIGRVVVLEHYPRTAIDVQRAVYDAAGDHRRVVAVLSVNSSGRLRDRLYAALALPALVKRAIEVLVDQSGGVAQPPEPPFEYLDAWTPLEIDRPLAEVRTFERNCELCRDARRSPIVTINPVTFEQEYLPQIKPITPCFKDPERNHKFWELCSTNNAIALDELPDSHAAKYRPRGRKMGIHVRWQPLLASGAFMTEIVKEMRSQRLREHVNRNVTHPGARLLLVPQSDAERPGFERLWGNVNGLLGVENYRAFPNDGEWGSDLLQEVTTAHDIMVFSLGVVSGGTLQRARNIVQSNRHDSNYDKLRALVLHARPSGAREWETFWNSYAKRVETVWRCYLPARSVLEEELALLDTLDSEQLDGDEARFWDLRKALCADGAVASGSAIFWGSRPSDHLSPHSIYGDGLNAVTTFVAVGAAMEAKRHEKYLVPQRMVFDFRAIMRSYYDPLILSAMLRWLLPYEQWWGAALPYEAKQGRQEPMDRVEGSATVVGELLWRADPEQRRILIPEILLAYAQGKVPQMEAECAISSAKRFIDEYSGDVRAAMKLALRLAGEKRNL